MTWTRFMDMHSGGGQKEKWAHIYIGAPKEEAKTVFYNRFGHNPERVTCTCCGDDYSINEDPTLEGASAYDRNCKWIHRTGKRYGSKSDGRYLEHDEAIPEGFEADDISSWRDEPQTVDEYQKSEGVLIIPSSEIKPEERVGEVPEQGYVWVD